MDNDRDIKFDSDRSPLEEQFCVLNFFEMSAIFKNMGGKNSTLFDIIKI
jgi:hypothetical protein